MYLFICVSTFLKVQLFILKTKNGELLTSQYQKELFTLNMLPKNKHRQRKNDEIKVYLNYTTVIKYALFLFLPCPFIFHQLNLLNIHKKMCLFCFYLLIYSQFACCMQSYSQKVCAHMGVIKY